MALTAKASESSVEIGTSEACEVPRRRLSMSAASCSSYVWSPSEQRIAESQLQRYQRWLATTRGKEHFDYDSLWQWSIDDLEGFWSSIWDYFEVRSASSYERVLADRRMPGAKWFPGATLNYAEHALRGGDHSPALVFGNELGNSSVLTYADLRAQVASVAAWLRHVGVAPDDRVVAVLPNIPEAVTAFLACASIGAIWSICSPDFGAPSILDRFAQVTPKVLIGVDGYTYAGKIFDRLADLRRLRDRLPTIEHTVLVSYLGASGDVGGATRWEDVAATPSEGLAFEQVPFDHPLSIVYSSGTTGPPKGLVHGHGGILLEQLRSHALHLDLSASDRFFWFSSTGWVMWNIALGSLLHGATVLLYDGSPTHPDELALWRFAAEHRATLFGASPPFFSACMRAGVRPTQAVDLTDVRTVGSTGAPLTAEAYKWIYANVSTDVLIASLSGGTDICSAFVGPCPTLPVYPGVMQRRWLGCAVEARAADGRSVVNDVGELVLTAPLPSMPTELWNDAGGSRYRSAYFDQWPGIWRHGDWVRILDSGGVVISGRSDSTLKRAGVRIGTAELYRVIETVQGVSDSLAVDTSHDGDAGRLVLFVVPQAGGPAKQLSERIVRAIRERVSPRHVPDEIHWVQEVPRTLNGKKLEVPAKRLLLGEDIEDVVTRGAVANPAALDEIAAISAARRNYREL